MDAFIVHSVKNDKYNFACKTRVFKSEESATEFINSEYKSYESISKDIYDEYKNTGKIEDVRHYNYPDLDDLIEELIDDEESESEILKQITKYEFITIYKNKIKINLENSLIMSSDI